MGFKVKGPHSFTLGYKPGYATPELVLPGEDLPEGTPESDLINLARNNNLTDENGGQYDVSEDAETGNEILVKVTLDKSGNPKQTPVSTNGVVSGQPSDAQVAQTAAQLENGNDQQPPVNVVGA